MSTNVNVSVTIQDSPQQRAGWSHAVAVALTVVLVAYALGWLPWLVAAVALYAAARIGWVWYVRAQAAAERERQRLAEIAARTQTTAAAPTISTARQGGRPGRFVIHLNHRGLEPATNGL